MKEAFIECYSVIDIQISVFRNSCVQLLIFLKMARSSDFYVKSTYLLELEATCKDAAVRYMEKTNLISVDPYSLGDSDFSYDIYAMPNITTMDIVTYLVLTHSYYTKEQMKAYKSLQGYKYFDAGFVANIGIKNVKEFVLLVSKVQHSMKASEPKLRVWILTQKDGGVCTAHCTCMAGLAEVCSHVAAVLYAVKLKENVTCTGKRASWPVPSQSGAEPTPVVEMDWGKPCPLRTNVEVPTLNTTGIQCLLEKIENQKCTAALIRIVPPFSENMSQEKVSLPSFYELYDKNNEQKSLGELIAHGCKLDLKVNDELKNKIEECTRDQRKCEEWYKQRRGRITASVFKRVCHTNILNPSISLVKSICYPLTTTFKSKATDWGIKHEEVAIKAYHEKMNENHEQFIVNEVGLIINEERSWLAATPDRIVFCECCLGGVVEVKCPYILRSGTVCLQDFAEMKNTCLVLDKSKKVVLDKSHAFYYQTQSQIFICNLQYCDFVVWCPTFLFIERILPDFNFWEENVQKASIFHSNVIMPELLGRYYTSRVPGGNIAKWCFCDTVKDDEMIQCGNIDCDTKYFHLKCVQSMSFSKENWICSICNLSMSHNYLG